MRRNFGDHIGYTLFYNDTIISIEEKDMCRLQYVCYIQNHNEYIRLDWMFVDMLLNLQKTIKELKERN